MRVTIVKVGEEAKVRFPFSRQIIEAVREMPGRLWNPDEKYWSIFVVDIPDFKRRIESMGHTVLIVEDRQSYRGPANSGTNQGWADSLFTAVGPDRVKSVYRALCKVLHPDADGGSEDLMKELGNAYGRHRSQ